ncbi:hypothetical protein RHGRI_010154 [Rhododendron griersonianum]|uniref:Aminotransferase class I/classII large domain-containing protein n=1 Tax=Rhododendron griersonianum TaxID=479676 RepID=A0AAV6KHF7_9ERIC|nr:hypothetical protein RHGRI_010154 [Rhododendron griersonianum]
MATGPSPKWDISHANGEGKTASLITVRSVLEKIMKNLNESDTRPVVPLGHGDPSAFPCFRTTRAAEDAIVDAVRSAKFNCYAPAVGIEPARRSIAEHLSRDLPYKLSPDDVYLTAGANHAIEVLVTALARPGANILLPRPGYPLYESRASFSQLEVRHFDLLPEKGWEVDLDSVEALANDRTVAMVVINPGNPCGNVLTLEHMKKVAIRDGDGSTYVSANIALNSELGHCSFSSSPSQIAETARKLGILLIADEVYGHLAFGSNPFVPVGIVEALKSYLNITADPTTFVQGAVTQILNNTTEDFFLKITNTLRKSANICYDRLKEIPCITCPHKAEGSMSTMVKLNLSLLEDISDDMDFCVKLAKEESVVVLPGFVVGLKNWLRVTFSVEPSLLEDGLGRIKAFSLRHAKKK